MPCMHRRQVETDVHSPAGDVAQVSILDSPAEIPLEDDLAEDRVQADLVAAVYCCGEPQVKPWVKMLIDFLICTCGAVVAFIRNDHVKIIWCKSVKSAYKTLNTRDNNFLAAALIFCDLESYRAVIIFRRLADQLFAMREDENTPLPWNVGKNPCLSESGCQITQIRAWRLLFDDIKTLLLVRSCSHGLPSFPAYWKFAPCSIHAEPCGS